MSATLDTAPVSAFLDGCPVVDVPGRMFPLEIAYAPGRSVVDVGVRRTRRRVVGAVLPAWRARDPASGRRPAAESAGGRRGRAAARLARRGRAGVARSRPSSRQTGHRGDEHRRDVADRAGRHRRRRHRTAQGRALRCRARHRQPRHRAHHADAADQRAGRAGRVAPGSSAGCGMRAIACGRTASRRFSASICRAPCSTSSRGAAIRGRSNGSSGRATKRSMRRWSCSSGSARRRRGVRLSRPREVR